jgi:hypothetical protein
LHAGELFCTLLILIDLAPLQFAQIYLKNRRIQQTVSEWVSPGLLDDSLWRYGIPKKEMIAELNHVDQNVTYTDLLSFLSTFLARPRYLEIGVSAGKNFYQISKQLRGTVLVGLDIEEMNPVLATRYSRGRKIWESAHDYDFTKHDGRPATKRFTLTEYADPETNNRLLYLSGNKFERELWEALSGMTFNLVFSDACHTPESVESELRFMYELGLIDPREFIMMWDDVTEGLLGAVGRATEILSQFFPKSDPYIRVSGIYGTYGGRHRTALFVHDEALRPLISNAILASEDGLSPS